MSQGLNECLGYRPGQESTEKATLSNSIRLNEINGLIEMVIISWHTLRQTHLIGRFVAVDIMREDERLKWIIQFQHALTLIT